MRSVSLSDGARESSLSLSLSLSCEVTARRNPSTSRETGSSQTQICQCLDLGLPSPQRCAEKPANFYKEIPRIKYYSAFISHRVIVVVVVRILGQSYRLRREKEAKEVILDPGNIGPFPSSYALDGPHELGPIGEEVHGFEGYLLGHVR